MLYSCPGQVMTGRFSAVLTVCRATQLFTVVLIVLIALWGSCDLMGVFFLTIPSGVIFLPESQGQKHKGLQRPVGQKFTGK